MPKFNVGDKVVVSSEYSPFCGMLGDVQSVFESSDGGTITYSVFVGGLKRFFHENLLREHNSTITLQQRAQNELKKLESTTLSVALGNENLLYLAGWHNGEWTCAKCGTMIGKNLRGESPFFHASDHAHSCK